MLDIETLRVAQGIVAATAFCLIFFGSYRSTRSPYAAWWTLVVAGAGLGSLAYLLTTTTAHALAAPLGNALGLVTGAGILASARSLRAAPTRGWFVVAVGVLGAAATVIESPDGPGWPGGASMPVLFTVLVGYAAVEYWRLVYRGRDQQRHVLGPDATAAIVSQAMAVTIVAAFYLARTASYFVLGPESDLYVRVLGPTATALAGCAAIVVVAFSVAHLSRYEVTQGWKLRATHDDLTGLLTRDAFREKAERELRRTGGVGATMILSDFDHFKRVNDLYGHARGDRALHAFGEACRMALMQGELAARWGGEEFILLLRFGGTERAKTVTASLSNSVARDSRRGEEPLTLSYGIVDAATSDSFDVLVSRADDALYRAKDAGRNRSVIYRQPREP
jgi:diguanylate cyclase (GGDEF)-like protein